MNSRRVLVAGGGAAGFFGAITCAAAEPDAEVRLLEKGPQFLLKVRISGGGRCNVTHACFEPRQLASHYPRGASALIGPLMRFQANDTIAWFESRGVKLKVEPDGRMFPTTDSSQTIVDCLLREARSVGVKLATNSGIVRVSRLAGGEFALTLANTDTLICDRLLLASGGCRVQASAQLPLMLGHTLEPPVPSLFTFHIDSGWLRDLAGISVDPAEASISGLNLRERGAILITHWGLSGPVILRLSAWGARALHQRDYQFLLQLNWLAGLNPEKIKAQLRHRRDHQAARSVVNSPIAPLPIRLWEQLVLAAGLNPDLRWAQLSRLAEHKLVQQLAQTEFQVTGKSLNKEEFVTCGGVPLKEINFKTMESRICPGLYFAGELLDIDGITGGFNFQAAWTTGWIAGQAIAESF